MAQAVIDGAGTEARVQDVAEGIDVGRELLVQIPGQEAQLLAGLDRGPGEDDPVDLSRLQGLRRQRTRALALAGARRADAEREAVAPDGVDVAFLGGSAGFERGGCPWRRVGGVKVGAGVQVDNVGVGVVLVLSPAGAGLAVPECGLLVVLPLEGLASCLGSLRHMREYLVGS